MDFQRFTAVDKELFRKIKMCVYFVQYR